ncbi:vacuolar fusion protein MON1 A-like protein [Dinothrombium tinctorium]|uniref:Vacuolar fusion protein MON1 homolog n=1 Tax=Dinothrombium tinctorium TaxID=1965070 RepID=A0A3S3SPN2_9ACAR|nr:vacuolar fusion protein MON1 A-like protein [Dinothrombium tinctorium]RWS17174.1 vacuolar fusion protein MON1 A-like protein [Dinothrombium tinctorium]
MDECERERNQSQCAFAAREKQPFDVFVLSEAGKPIYSYRKREDIVTLLPLCQALCNYFYDTQNDYLRFITTSGGLKITFCTKTPLILVVVTHCLSGIDPNIVVNQVHSQITSILTGRTLKNVFEQSPTFDLRRLLTGSEKMVDTLVEEGLLMNKATQCKQIVTKDGLLVECFLSFGLTSAAGHCRSNSALNQSTSNIYQPKQRSHIRVMVPILLLQPSIRDSITNILLSSVTSNCSNILFSLLIQIKCNANNSLPSGENFSNYLNTKLITIINHNSKVNKLSPSDAQLLQTLVIASENQLCSAESLWLPICLPRFDSSAFMHAHISYLNASTQSTGNNMCLILLTTNREDFHKCQMVKESVRERLSKIQLTSPHLGDLNIPHLQVFWYQSLRSQSVFYRVSPQISVTKFNSLIHFMASRMLTSNLKSFWFRSDQHKITLLGWHSPTFQIYVQFDVTVTQSSCLSAAQSIIKWIKNEEGKFVFKDYQ